MTDRMQPSEDEHHEPDVLPDLEPPIHERQLPDEVAALRQIADAHAAELDAAIQPLIERHIAVYQSAVDALIETHRALADETDMEMAAPTRWAATWEMSGRCLAISNALLHDLRGKFASEAIGTCGHFTRPRNCSARSRSTKKRTS